MNLAGLLKATTELLQKEKMRFALAGGLVASLYRTQMRLTQDLDFLIFSRSDHEAEARRLLGLLGLNAVTLTKADLEGGPQHLIKSRRSPVWMVSGISPDKEAIRVDFLLPTFPWAERALERAEKNLIDFGFGPVSCLTREDLVLAKLFAVSMKSDRFKDLDDLQDIFQQSEKLDLNYLSDRIAELRLKKPLSLRDKIPRGLEKSFLK